MWIHGMDLTLVRRGRFQALLRASDLALAAARLPERIGLFVPAIRQVGFKLSNALSRAALDGWRRDRATRSRG